MKTRVGMIDAIQSMLNATFAWSLERNGDWYVALLNVILEYRGAKNITARTIPNTVSPIVSKISIQGNDLYNIGGHIVL